MNKKIRWIAETGVMLAALIALQAVTKPLGQLVTGSCVNAVLAISVLVVGLSSGVVVSLVSPVFAFLFNIAPNFVTVLPIMIGNVCFVTLLKLVIGKQHTSVWRRFLALGAASAVKFGILYLLVVEVICGSMADALLGQKIGTVVVLAPPMLKLLPTMFAWPQLITAFIGGSVALLISPILRKSLHR
ncbi:MAG: hypothetical protein J6A88_00815 [Oscillospiraceae bacterium]|nr:hypothetical protein [Oscillospiraceae bacterium]